MVLEDHFFAVRASDAFDYGDPGAEVLDFLNGPTKTNSVDRVTQAISLSLQARWFR